MELLFAHNHITNMQVSHFVIHPFTGDLITDRSLSLDEVYQLRVTATVSQTPSANAYDSTEVCCMHAVTVVAHDAFAAYNIILLESVVFHASAACVVVFPSSAVDYTQLCL